MIKLIILFVAGFFLYRFLKSMMSSGADGQKQMGRGRAPEIEDEMVKDPLCGVYFPKRSGVPLRHEGQDLLFCSEACRDEFLASRKKSQSD